MTTSLQRTSLGELSYSPLLATSLGELGIIEEEVKRKVHPPGMGDARRRRERIIREDDEIVIALVMAFLEIMDD